MRPVKKRPTAEDSQVIIDRDKAPSKDVVRKKKLKDREDEEIEEDIEEVVEEKDMEKVKRKKRYEKERYDREEDEKYDREEKDDDITYPSTAVQTTVEKEKVERVSEVLSLKIEKKLRYYIIAYIIVSYFIHLDSSRLKSRVSEKKTTES